MDVILSNCVINLSPDKLKVFSEIFRVLKPNGQLYFSDIFSDRRIPLNLKDGPLLLGECLSGALYIEDFRRLMLKLGYPDFRVVKKSKISITNKQVQDKIGNIEFYSYTISLFKLIEMEDICEDYGQTATDLGTIPQSKSSFILDDHHKFIVNKPMLVCGNTAAMVSDTRFGKHFKVTGNKKVHYGPFDCSSKVDSSDRSCC